MEFNIPLFDLNFDEHEQNAVIDTLKSKWISTGPKCKLFEDQFAQKSNSKFALSVANCTVALHLAMEILDIKEGDEVICPSLTFVATVNAIRYVNASPVFADIKSIDEPFIDADTILPLITNKTKAIVLMHYGGFICDIEKIVALAKKNNIKIIEDACHAPFSTRDGHTAGTFGDVGCFSFFSNKNISTGEGGMIITNNQEYYDKLKLLRSHGMTTMSYERAKGHSTTYDVIEFGYNYRMDDIRASIGIAQLTKIDDDYDKRQILRDLYIKLLQPIKGITIPFVDHNYRSSNYIFPIVLNNSSSIDRDSIRDKLHENGIQTSVHYPAVHKFSAYQQYDNKKLVNTEYYADNTITLPLYSQLKPESVKFIANTLLKILE